MPRLTEVRSRSGLRDTEVDPLYRSSPWEFSVTESNPSLVAAPGATTGTRISFTVINGFHFVQGLLVTYPASAQPTGVHRVTISAIESPSAKAFRWSVRWSLGLAGTSQECECHSPT